MSGIEINFFLYVFISGKNCYTPNRVILNDGEVITEDGLQCKCKFSEDDPEEPEADCSETVEGVPADNI